MLIRGNGALHAYTTCRSLRLGILHSLYRAARYALTGRTGKYRIHWSRSPE
jgi:hypothetical protein